MRWADITIILMHDQPRSQGARVIVVRGGRHIVSSASHEGMTVDDPHIQGFFAWARAYYEGATVREESHDA